MVWSVDIESQLHKLEERGGCGNIYCEDQYLVEEMKSVSIQTVTVTEMGRKERVEEC